MTTHRRLLGAAAGLALLGLAGWATLGGQDAEAPVVVTAAATPSWPTLPATAAELGPASAEPLASSGAAPPPALSIGQLAPVPALRLLKSCYFADSCGFPQTDNLSSHFAASKAIADRLALLSTNGDVAQSGALAREFLAFPDGHVQAAALALAARLPPDSGTVNAAVSALSDSYDEQLFRQALPVLQQWQQLGMSSGFDDMLATTLHTGGVHAAQVVAENLRPFLNDGNIGRFESVLKTLQPGAREAALRQSLRDYRLLSAGG